MKYLRKLNAETKVINCLESQIKVSYNKVRHMYGCGGKIRRRGGGGGGNKYICVTSLVIIAEQTNAGIAM